MDNLKAITSDGVQITATEYLYQIAKMRKQLELLVNFCTNKLIINFL